ncbi:MAG TPA: NADH-quinone oxidoreductase subunit NuoG [Bacteroidales bacterium]|nr:NADH-quinone oxidoreductase subunit NuoG [Bacteroidales bacterium]HRZ48723.1 NADH-quinone oxidoreductase subunit NuoG [Bacteroidales bacterium]
MAKIILNGKEVEADAGKNLLEVILSSGEDLPYFCWHPKMGSVGACRQCAVVRYKDENDTTGRIVMACMEPASDGSVISTNAPAATEFRARIIESLMTNHPHDCPVCDEGGECHLQDMTVMSGHQVRRYEFGKRTHNNQYLGPFINHEMNRCIQCYRCVRFYRDYAGGTDLNVFSSRNKVYFGRAAEGALESEFSGNLVEICPTGVFTDKTFMDHPTRKWDLTAAPSICHHCSVGCNTIATERYGIVRRIYSRYNGEVNNYFLCDRGRFGYEFTNSDKRIRAFKIPGTTEPAGHEEAMQYLAKALKGKSVAAVGSPRASLETNFALKQLVGDSHFSLGMNTHDLEVAQLAFDIVSSGKIKVPSLKEIEQCDSVFILGEDLTQTAPMMALSVRQSIRNQVKPMASQAGIPNWNEAPVRQILQKDHGPLHIAATMATRLDDVATSTFFNAPAEIARLGYAVAHFINQRLRLPDGMEKRALDLAQRIAKDLMASDKPLIISGVHSKSKEVIMASADVALALSEAGKAVSLSLTFEECNTAGLLMLGGSGLEDLPAADVLIVQENDLFRRMSADKAEKMLASYGLVIAIDHIASHTTSNAQVVIPVGSFAESDGTLVSQEGRAQRFYQVFMPEGDTPEPWRRLAEISMLMGKPFQAHDFHEFTSWLAKSNPEFTGIDTMAPPPDFRMLNQRIPREFHRFSGRTSMKAHRNIHEQKPPEDPDSPLSFTMEGYQGHPDPSLITGYWAPGWNSVQAINKYQIEVGGPLHGGDPGLRLFDQTGGQLSYYQDIPQPLAASVNGWTMIPVYHIFGSEELSRKSPPVKEKAESAGLFLNPATAAEAGIKEGDRVIVQIGAQPASLEVKYTESLGKGFAGVPMGYCGVNPEIAFIKYQKEK